MPSGDVGGTVTGYVSVASLEVKERHGIYSRNIEFNSSKLSGN